MTNDLIPASTTLPGIVEDEVDVLVDGFARAINTERGFDALPRLPNKMERAAMESRRLRVVRRLAPIFESMTQREDLMKLLGQLWVRYPSLRNADVTAMGAAYSEDLQVFPMFAVQAAIEDVRHNRIKSLDPDWPPTSVRLVAAAQKYVEPAAAARLQVERVLKIDKIALPDNAAMSTKLSQDVQAFIKARREEAKLDEQRIREDICKPMAQTSARMIREEYRAHGLEPIGTGPREYPISLSLARKMGIAPERRS